MRWSPFIAVLVAAACGDGSPTRAPPTLPFPSPSLEDRLADASRARDTWAVLARADSNLRVEEIEVGDTRPGTVPGGVAGVHDAWVFRLDEPSWVSVRVSAPGAAPGLALLRGEPGAPGTLIVREDPPASTVRVQLAEGVHTLLLWSPSDTGVTPYHISVQAGRADAEPAAPLRPPTTRRDSLSASSLLLEDGTPHESWTYDASGGERLTVTLASADFDPYLALLQGTPERAILLAESGSVGNGNAARVSAVLTEAGPYTVLVTSTDVGARGSYELQAQSEPLPGLFAFDNAGPSSEGYALLVGVGNYPGDGHDLATPVRDVLAMRQLLISEFGFREEHIVVLTDEDASRANVANGVLQHLGQAGARGTSMFYYSGLGTALGRNPATPEGAGADDGGLLLPGPGGTVQLLLDEELDALLGSLGAGRSLAILDTSYGDAAPGTGEAEVRSKGVGPEDPFLDTWLRPAMNFITVEPGVTTELSVGRGLAPRPVDSSAEDAPPRVVRWTAAGGGGPAWSPAGPGGLSLFTGAVLNELTGVPPTRTLGEVHAAVLRRVERQARDLGLPGPRHPELESGADTLVVGEYRRRR